MSKMRPILAALLLLPAPAAGASPAPPAPPMDHVRTLSPKVDFMHETGREGSVGRRVDYKRDEPGYVLRALHEPLVLGPGFYRLSFHLRRGHYPGRGLLHETNVLFELEIWDAGTGTQLARREIQTGDLNSSRFEPRWIEFSVQDRERLVEPRVRWPGTANGEVGDIHVHRFPPVSLRDLALKAERIETALRNGHLENGFVVSREPDGRAEETGDALTYTGFYVAALAWKVAATRDPAAIQALENGLATLHSAIKGAPDAPILTRFVDADGQPYPKPPSKDVYTSYFFAASAAAPHLENAALRKQLRRDTGRLALRFLNQNLGLRGSERAILNLSPFFTVDDVRHGVHKLATNRKSQRRVLKVLRTLQRTVPFFEVWPGLSRTVEALRRGNEEELVSLAVPTLNGAILIVERIHDWLDEHYRTDLFPRSPPTFGFSGRRLAGLIGASLQKLPPRQRDGRRFQRLSDLRVLASNAILSLHIVRAAGTVSRLPAFEEYYRSNLYGNDALLKTAVDWFGVEDEALRLASGNAAADRSRRGYLSALALYALYSNETNPAVKNTYRELIAREWEVYRHDDNPLVAAFHLASGGNEGLERDLILRALSLYDEQRRGFGDDYWERYGDEVAERFGGGEYRGYAREPLPVSHRPRDSFLWQRNARRLRGDFERTYPGTEYLFLYWFARHQGLIPEEPSLPTVQR